MTKTGPKRRDMAERFWEKVDIRGADDCWTWLAYKDQRGYGAFGISRTKMEWAHRTAWRLSFGEIPEDYCVCHHCDNPSCVNPKHLFLGTRIDNNRDRDMKGRNVAPLGEQNGVSKLKRKEVIEIRNLWRGGELSQREIADKFGVHSTTIHAVVRYKTWKHLP